MTAVDVVIPIWNSRPWLAGCLDALARQTLAPNAIICVDDASTDGSAEWLAEHAPQVRIVQLSEHSGFAIAANRGITSSTAPLVALLNVDTEAADDWLARLTSALEQAGSPMGSAASKMLQLADPSLVDNAGDRFSRYGSATKRGRGEPAESWTDPGLLLSASAGAALYRRSMLDEVGLFDESFGSYLEDIELGLRAQLAGYGCLFVPDAQVRHQGGGSGLSRRRYVRLITANRAATVLQTFPLRLLRRHCWRLLWGQWYFLVASRHPLQSLLGYGDLLRRLRVVAKNRRQIQGRRRVTVDHIDGLLDPDLGEPPLRRLLAGQGRS